MEQLSFKVQEFEGPLDLMLHLVQKHKLNLYDIEISALLEQYLATIRSWQEQNLEVASEFLEMAARLVYLKTVMLLPRREEEKEQLKQELTGQLLEYQACRLAAEYLRQEAAGREYFTRPPLPLEEDAAYPLHHEARLLARAYAEAVSRGQRRLPPRGEEFAPLVSGKVVSVPSRIFFILRQARGRGGLDYRRLLLQSRTRSELVATFLAILELMKGGRLLLEEDGALRLRDQKQGRAPHKGG